MKYLHTFTILFYLISLAYLQTYAQRVENRNLRSFHAVQASGSLNVILERGHDESVRIEVRNIDPDEVITEVKGGVLKIYEKNGNWKKGSGTIYISYRSINGLSLSGSADVKCRDRISGREVAIKCSGSGNLTASSIDANQLVAQISGSGNLYLAGDVDSQILKISGSGNIEADDLECDDTQAQISGSGNMSLVAYDRLDVRISGSGNIRYRGNSPRIYSKSTGSGILC